MPENLITVLYSKSIFNRNLSCGSNAWPVKCVARGKQKQVLPGNISRNLHHVIQDTEYMNARG